MNTSFRLFPESASTFSGRVDQVYFFHLAVAAFFTALICFLILYFAVKYRRRSGAKHENISSNYWLEAGWGTAALALTMVMFVWGAKIYFEMHTPPLHTLDIDVVAKQWMWKVQHPDGRAEINELHLPVGQPVRLRMISQDVIHSFYVPAFRVKQDVLPGRYSTMWFEATRVGQFHLLCAEYCGTDHARMRGTAVVMEPQDYANWLAGDAGEPPATAGRRLFERFRCGSCHKSDDAGPGPVLAELYGKTVPLQGGGTATADDHYLRDSILNPSKQIVAGYQPLMPLYQGQLNESEVLQLIAYLRTLKRESPPHDPSPQEPPE